MSGIKIWAVLLQSSCNPENNECAISGFKAFSKVPKLTQAQGELRSVLSFWLVLMLSSFYGVIICSHCLTALNCFRGSFES